MSLIVTIYHSTNRFLGTPGGELLKRGAELVLLIITTYMIASEYSRTKEKHLKYLTIAFSVLAVQRLLVTVIMLNAVFGSKDLMPLIQVFVINSCLEIFGLILIASAFLFPLFKKRIKEFRKRLKYQILGLLILFIILQAIWSLTLKDVSQIRLSIKVIMILTEIVKIGVFLAPIYLMLRHRNVFGKYTTSTVIAFAVYLVTPVLDIINRAFFGGNHYQLIVLIHPFPFISILLFLRVVYLKLADKVSLRLKLNKAEIRYKQEKELGKLKDEFMSVMSHELRTPLTSMNLYTSLLLDEKMGKLNEKQKKTINIVKLEGQRLANLISDILDLSRLEAKRVKLKFSKYNLHKLVEHSIYQNLAEQKQINVINKIPKDFIVKVDTDKFTQVFINLVSNAIKYTPQKGRIVIEAKRFQKHWEFSVTDNGKGIPRKQIPKLFDKFYQVEDYLTREKGGTGLGLAIVRQIVHLHKGRIQVKSKVGKGSTFTVIMPYK